MKVACDYCEKVEQEEGLVAWWEARRIGYRTIGDDVSGRFCSAACLRKFVLDHTEGQGRRRGQ